MKAAVCVLLLSGLLAGLAEGFPDLYFQEPQQALTKGSRWKDGQDTQVRDLPKQSSRSEEDDKSFIAEEDTEEGQLWASDDDPDWKPSQSQEDYSQYDDYSQEEDSGQEEDFSQEEDYIQEEDSSQEEDYIQEEDSGEADYTQEDQSLDDDDIQHGHGGQGDTQPFPEVLVSDDRRVNADYWWLHPGGAHQQDDRPTPVSLKSKRYIQSPYQTSQVVQVPEVVQVPAAYENDPYRPGVSAGVEPLLPVRGRPQHEVAAGVEPVLDAKDEQTGESSGGSWWDRFTGGVEDTIGHIGDKVEVVADKLHETYHGLLDKASEIVKRFKVLMRKFGLVVQEGIRYCLRRFEHSVDQVQESAVIEKLEKKLEQGHAEVAKFFQILGEKIKAWREEKTSNIDEGLLEGYTQQGQQQQQEGQQTQYIEDNIPDFFQDLEVLVQLNKLRDEGVLTQNDVIILTEDHPNQHLHIHQDQHQHNQHQNQQQSQQNQQQNQNQNQQQNYHQQSQFSPKFIQFPQ